MAIKRDVKEDGNEMDALYFKLVLRSIKKDRFSAAGWIIIGSVSVVSAHTVSSSTMSIWYCISHNCHCVENSYLVKYHSSNFIS